MEWMQVQIEDSCNINCRQCKTNFTDLQNISIYGEWNDRIKGKQAFVFVQQDKINKKMFELEIPCLTNQPSHFLMYLQKIKCSYCFNPLGIYFRTANTSNIFALKKYGFDITALNFKESALQIIGELFKQELDKSKQSMVKKQYKQKHIVKQHPHSIEQTVATIEDASRTTIKKGKVLGEKIMKELQNRLNISNNE